LLGPAVNIGGSLVPSGYTLLKEWDLTRDEGWYRYTGHTISQAYYQPANISFDSTWGLRIRCTNEPSGDSQWSSGQISWGNGLGTQPDGFLPQNAFYTRMVAKMLQPPIEGDFPCYLWHRTINGTAKGEIDQYEMMANHLPVSQNPLATQSTAKSNKVTMITTPYDNTPNNKNYSKEYNYQTLYPSLYTQYGATLGREKAEFQMCQEDHIFETYKTPNQMVQYVDNNLMSTHTAGGTTDDGTIITQALWDANFNSGFLMDMRICYQYGDWIEPSGKQHVGNAGPAQNFAGNRYMQITELLAAVPS
jgi:hypothetical protein